MRTYAEQTFGPWVDHRMRQLLRERLSPSATRIVVLDGRDAGMLEVYESDAEVVLANIRVAPEYQGQGIGTRLISTVVQAAHRRGVPVVKD